MDWNAFAHWVIGLSCVHPMSKLWIAIIAYGRLRVVVLLSRDVVVLLPSGEKSCKHTKLSHGWLLDLFFAPRKKCRRQEPGLLLLFILRHLRCQIRRLRGNYLSSTSHPHCKMRNAPKLQNKNGQFYCSAVISAMQTANETLATAKACRPIAQLMETRQPGSGRSTWSRNPGLQQKTWTFPDFSGHIFEFTGR